MPPSGRCTTSAQQPPSGFRSYLVVLERGTDEPGALAHSVGVTQSLEYLNADLTIKVAHSPETKMSSFTTQPGDDEIQQRLKALGDELMLIYRDIDQDVLLAWEEGRLKVAKDLMEYNPTPDFFLGISGYKNRVGTREGACVFLVIDKTDHTGLKQVLEMALAKESIRIDDVLIFTGTPRVQAKRSITGRVLDPDNGEYSMEVPPGQSIGEASSAKSGTLGMWLPQDNSFITTAHVISPDELLATPYPHKIGQGLEVRSPSNQDVAISRARLVNSRAAKHAYFRRSWFKFLGRLQSLVARVMVWSVLESEAALRNHDNQEPLRYVGDSIAGWRGIVGMADPKGVQKEFWIDVAVVAGDQGMLTGLNTSMQTEY